MELADDEVLKVEYSGGSADIIKAVADANALLANAKKIENKLQAAGYTRNVEVALECKEALMSARWEALGAVARARKMIEKESRLAH